MWDLIKAKRRETLSHLYKRSLFRWRRQLLKHASPATEAIHFTTNMHFAVCLWLRIPRERETRHISMRTKTYSTLQGKAERGIQRNTTQRFNNHTQEITLPVNPR